MKPKPLSLVAAVALFCLACGMSAAGRASPGSRSVMTSEEMVAINAQTAYEAVQRLRPEWFSTRGPTALTNAEPDVASVFLGGNQIGDIEALRRITPDDVKELRYYDTAEAGARFGMGHSRGVIDVIMKGSEG